MVTNSQEVGQEFYSMLREREAQARAFGTRHLCAVHNSDSMLYWLARAATKARTARGRLQVHVAASASVNQSTIDRFESHIAWPRDADAIVGAYADDLDVAPLELWEQAIKMWRADQEAREQVDRATREIAQAGRPEQQRHGRA